MAISLYMDEHIPAALTEGLRLREVDVLTVQEDGKCGVDDASILDRALELQRVMFSEDDDMLIEVASRQRSTIPFSGLIHTTLYFRSIGECISELELICKACELAEFENAVQYI